MFEYTKEKLSELGETASIFGSTYTAKELPVEAIPEGAMVPEDAYQLIHDELYLDGNARQNLATFCQTWNDDQVHKLMDLSINKNMIDKDEYPETAAIEMRCVAMLAKLWNASETETPIGCSTIGSSEACMLGGMAALWRWRARQKAAGKPTDKPNMVCGPVQICWHKFCRYWDVEMRMIEMIPGTLHMDPERMLAAVDENTICVMPTFGVTYTGEYEMVEPIAKALDEYEKKTGINIDIHVDAASGGFLAPFCAPEIKFDFRLPRVKSISASGHKYGLAPLGTGWVIWRDNADMPRDLQFDVNYLGGQIPTIAINFSRPAGQIIAQYYLFVRLGMAGYRAIQQSCYDTAQFLYKEIAKLGPFEFISTGDPKKDIPAVCWYIKEGSKLPYNLYDLSDRLRMRGWQLPAFTLSGQCSHITVARVMIRRGLSMNMAGILLDDIKRELAYFEQNPVDHHSSAANGTVFNHN